MSEERRRSLKGGPPGERYTIRCPIDFSALPFHYNCRCSLPEERTPEALRALAADLRRNGYRDAAFEPTLPQGPSHAPTTWFDVGLILGTERLLRICKIAGAA